MKRFVASSEMGNENKEDYTEEVGPSEAKLEDNTRRGDQGHIPASWFPFGHLFSQPWSNQRQEPKNGSDTRYISQQQLLQLCFLRLPYNDSPTRNISSFNTELKNLQKNR